VQWNPHEYQKKAVKFLLDNKSAALFLDPGLGKTSITLEALRQLKKNKEVNKILLIAPLRCCTAVWAAEIQKWANFNHLRVVVLHGSLKEKRLSEKADIYIINPEGIDWLLGIKRASIKRASNSRRGVKEILNTPRSTKGTLDKERWAKLNFDTLVIDELSKFKHTDTSRFKSLKLVLPTFNRRWGLTGSPASNGLVNLFGQCYVLDMGECLGTSVNKYRFTYFTQGYNGFGWNIKDGAEQEIYRKIAPLALRMGANDYLEMPELINNNIIVELPREAFKTYLDLENELIAIVGANEVVAKNAAAASIKCRQVANGGIYLDIDPIGGSTKKEALTLHEKKLDALEDLIEELQGAPLLVAYEFGHDLARLLKRFGYKTPYIGGGVSIERTNEIAKLWNAGKIPLLLGHPQAMAHGLNLQEIGHHVAWHSLTWDFELYDQFIRRVLRQGNKSKKVFVHHIVAKNTIDEVVLRALHSKKKGQDALFEALKLLALKNEK
jgi:SNF2 family DNA or RNA helicase